MPLICCRSRMSSASVQMGPAHSAPIGGGRWTASNGQELKKVMLNTSPASQPNIPSPAASSVHPQTGLPAYEMVRRGAGCGCCLRSWLRARPTRPSIGRSGWMRSTTGSTTKARWTPCWAFPATGPAGADPRRQLQHRHHPGAEASGRLLSLRRGRTLHVGPLAGQLQRPGGHDQGRPRHHRRQEAHRSPLLVGGLQDGQRRGLFAAQRYPHRQPDHLRQLLADAPQLHHRRGERRRRL